MSLIFSGIIGLKKIAFPSKAGATQPQGSIGKKGKIYAAEGMKAPLQSEKVVTAKIRLDGHLLIPADKEKEVQKLIHHRLLCEEAFRLKQEVRNFSSIFFCQLS